jgi:hypothetical protein
VDLKKAKKEGFLPASAEIIFPSTEAIPLPPAGFRVMFLAFLLHGLSLPTQEFLCGLLVVYGVQLHQLTPNSLLHIDPHWVLWKYLFCLLPSCSNGEIPELGDAIVSVRSESQYLDFKIAQSVQG